jgi:hypothetical protein
LITIGFIAIRIGLIMWISHAVVALLGDGVCQREGVFWMRPIIIAGRILLQMTEKIF